jgi:hypothetical protein
LRGDGLLRSRLLRKDGKRHCSRCAAQDDQAQGAQAMAHDMLRNFFDNDQRYNPFTQARSEPASFTPPAVVLMAVDCGTFS